MSSVTPEYLQKQKKTVGVSDEGCSCRKRRQVRARAAKTSNRDRHGDRQTGLQVIWKIDTLGKSG